MTKRIPVEIWKAACESASLPLAIVGLDNKFIWVNKSFEQFTGYPLAELSSMTWIDITTTDDVGGDLASIENIIKGKSVSYVMDKKYLHRRGHEIDVTVIVRRWPNEPETIAMFFIEAIPPTVTKCELENVAKELKDRIVRLESNQIHKSPHEKESEANEALKIRYFAIGFLALLGMMMYLFYCLVMLQLKQTPNAPSQSVASNICQLQ